jgi:hypothetical protein
MPPMPPLTVGADQCYAYINRFEELFKEHLSVKYAIATSSCTHTITHNSSLNAQLAEVLETLNEGSDTPTAAPEGFNSRFPVTLAYHLLYGRLLLRWLPLFQREHHPGWQMRVGASHPLYVGHPPGHYPVNAQCQFSRTCTQLQGWYSCLRPVLDTRNASRSGILPD